MNAADLKLDNATVLLGDCIQRMKELPDCSVQMCVTSPPYFGLRDYGHEGQIGLEQTPDEYVAKMVEVFREVQRVLADDGTLWLNIGDSYAQAGGRGKQGSTSQRKGRSNVQSQEKRASMNPPVGLKPKDLIGIPWMLAFALRSDGWWLRQDIVWQKGNPMPESVRDRCTKAHEYIFLLSKSERYFFDHHAMREPGVIPAGTKGAKGSAERQAQEGVNARPPEYKVYDGMRNRRSVWTVNTRPYAGAHFAVYPPELIEPCVLAGTSERGHCPACGKRWERVVERTKMVMIKTDRNIARGTRTGTSGTMLQPASSKSVGFRPTCSCGANPVPDTVLDPFNGSGTTGQVAIEHGRRYLGIELNPEYLDLTRQRLEATIERVKPGPQLPLFAAE